MPSLSESVVSEFKGFPLLIATAPPTLDTHPHLSRNGCWYTAKENIQQINFTRRFTNCQLGNLVLFRMQTGTREPVYLWL